MFVYRIYCGTDTNGHDVDGKQLALDLAAKNFPNGHTVFYADGRWTGEVGVINEQTVVIEYLAHSAAEGDKKVGKFAFEYKNQAYQESVLVTKREQDAFFV